MKRDWELIRKLLIAVENSSYDENITPYSISGYDPELVGYHIKLLSDARLVDVIRSNSDSMIYEYYASDLTLSGHEFLDGIRNENSWKKIKTIIKSKGAELTFDTVKAAIAYLVANLFT